MWYRMLELALLKGLAQGSIITAPAMLVMQLVGKEGTLGATQAIGGLISACVLYAVGRITAPHHRDKVFSAALVLFLAGAVVNAVLFNTAGVLVFLGCLVLAKPMLDLAYNPIEMSVIDAVAGIEGRSEYAYFLNHEFALFAGRFLGCVLFLAIDACWSGTAALKYALPVVAILQLLSMQVAGMVSREMKENGSDF
jgi:YQGE family putative transporter